MYQRDRISFLALIATIVVAVAPMTSTALSPHALELAAASDPILPLGQSVDGASCGETIISQNANPNVISTGTPVCAAPGGGPTRANSYARFYSIFSDLTVNCVDFAIESNTGGDWPVQVRLYKPLSPGFPSGALVQLGPTITIDIPDNTQNQFFTATFPDGVYVPAWTTLVVELFQPCRETVSSASCPPGGDGGRLLFGTNNLGQAKPSYIKAPGCGVANYIALSSIGFPNAHLIQMLRTSAGPCNTNLSLCNGDVAGPNHGVPDGFINVIDVLRVIETWGQTSEPDEARPTGDCAPLPQGDCIVNVQDLLEVVTNWGECPEVGSCCIGGGCLNNYTPAQCTAIGGLFFADLISCGGVVCDIGNDNCQGAYTLTAGTHTINNFGATSSPQQVPNKCVGGPGNLTRDVWYKYKATATGSVKVNLCATTGPVTDTVLAIYSGTCPSNLTLVECNNDGCPGPSLFSSILFTGIAREVYYIRVGSWGPNVSNQGPMTLVISASNSEPPNLFNE